MEDIYITYKLFPSFTYDEENNCYVDKNNKIYPKEILRAAMTEFITNKVESRRALGEFVYMDEGNTHEIEINLHKASHLLNHVTMLNDETYIGEFRLLNTHRGKVLKEIVKANSDLVKTEFVGIGTVHNHMVDTLKICRFNLCVKEEENENDLFN